MKRAIVDVYLQNKNIAPRNENLEREKPNDKRLFHASTIFIKYLHIVEQTSYSIVVITISIKTFQENIVRLLSVLH